jgi:hypothetical protein
MEKRQNLQQMFLGKLDTSVACRKLKLDPHLSPHTSVNSKWIKDLNINPETLMLKELKTGHTLELIGMGNDFLNRTQKAQ